MNDARKKREFMKYALEIIRVAKIINMSIFTQITLIYIGMNLKFQRSFIKFIEIIIMNECLQKLKKKKNCDEI